MMLMEEFNYSNDDNCYESDDTKQYSSNYNEGYYSQSNDEDDKDRGVYKSLSSDDEIDK